MTNAPRSITEPQFSGIGRQRCSLCGQEMHGIDHAELQRQRIAELESAKGTMPWVQALEQRAKAAEAKLEKLREAIEPFVNWPPEPPFSEKIETLRAAWN